MQIDRDFMDGIERLSPTGAAVHCDLSRGFPIFPEKAKRGEAILAHYDAIRHLLGDIPLFFPAFSYSFFTQRVFDVQHTVSEIGILPEYFRQNLSVWRTRDPVFSYCGDREVVGYNGDRQLFGYRGDHDLRSPGDAVADPFGEGSFFQYLYDSNALFFHYGSGIEHSTIIHFVERKLGIVPYRYDKLFEGTITDGASRYDVVYRFHARPRGMHMAYDWEKLARDLTMAGIFHTFSFETTLLSYMGVREMTDYLLERLRADPYYLLDAQTVAWVVPAIEKLNRPLLLEDFE